MARTNADSVAWFPSNSRFFNEIIASISRIVLCGSAASELEQQGRRRGNRENL